MILRLEQNGGVVVSVLRGLTDEQLAETATHSVCNVERIDAGEIVEHLLTGHRDLDRGGIRAVRGTGARQ